MDLPKGYGVCILGCGVAPMIVSTLMGGQVMKARKKYDVNYPNLYAVPGVHKMADEFNNIQRGHQNMFETSIFYVPLSLITGLKHPLTIGLGGFAYCLGTWTFQSNYMTGAKKRNDGVVAKFKYVGLLTTLITSIKVAIGLL
jgi:glutathione S-transferase